MYKNKHSGDKDNNMLFHTVLKAMWNEPFLVTCSCIDRLHESAQSRSWLLWSLPTSKKILQRFSHKLAIFIKQIRDVESAIAINLSIFYFWQYWSTSNALETEMRITETAYSFTQLQIREVGSIWYIVLFPMSFILLKFLFANLLGLLCKYRCKYCA